MTKIKDYINIIKLKKSNFFDESYYKMENPEVRGSAAKHYYYKGYKESKNPSEKFDNDYYLNYHKDVKDANINPLVHYLKNGKKEKRKIKGFNGLKIKRLYHKIYKRDYFVNVFLVNESRKINIIVEDLNEEMYSYLKEIMKSLKIDRLFYKNITSKIYKNLYKKINLERIYSDYYLKIGIEDINICLDIYSLISFNNSSYINNVYMYINNAKNYNQEMLNYIAYYAKIGKIKIISNNIKIPAPMVGNISSLFDEKRINFILNYNILLVLEIVNTIFLEKNFRNDIELYYNMKNVHYKLYLDCGKNIICNMQNEEMKKVYFEKSKIYLDNNEVIINFDTNEILKTYSISDFLLANKK